MTHHGTRDTDTPQWGCPWLMWEITSCRSCLTDSH